MKDTKKINDSKEDIDLENPKIEKKYKKRTQNKKKDFNKETNIDGSSNFKIAEVVVLVVLTCIISLITGSTITSKLLDKQTPAKEENVTELDEFVENYKYIIENYDGKIEKADLIDNAIAGMLSGLDDYSVFMGKESNTFDITLQGSYKGVGLEISNDEDKNIIITGIFENSPASKAGLKIGDKIITVDGISLKDKTTTYLSNYILTNKNTNFELIIIRDSKQKSIKVSKELITIDSVTSKIYIENGKKIGYIRISIFAENTYEQFKSQLKELESKKISSLIIDVRGNGGGHLSTVSDMLSLFMDKTHIIYQTNDNGYIKKTYSLGEKNATYPIIILQNGQSASGSELLSASLNEGLGAKIIGETSYGKGTVQEVKTLSNGNKYKLTTKKWLTPNGIWIDGVGVKPTIPLKLSNKYNDEPIEKNDNQLKRALKELAK